MTIVSPLFPLSLKSKDYILDSRLAYNLYVILNSVRILLMQFHVHLNKLGNALK